MLEQCMAVMELFSPSVREIGVVGAARRLGAGKGTVSRWLSAMHHAGFLERDPDSQKYRLSIRIAVLGELAKDASSLQRLATAELGALASETGETSTLAVLAGSEAMNVAAVESPRPIMHTGWVGRRLPLHATASGKVLLAWNTSARVKQLVPTHPKRLTDRTITRVDELIRQLGEVRKNGYSVAWAELENDLAAVAAPVRDHTGSVIGALSVGAPVSRADAERLAFCVRAVVKAADSLSARLGYHEAAR